LEVRWIITTLWYNQTTRRNTMTNINIPTQVKDAIQAFQAEGIESFFVGGCVRDAFLGIESDDIDICLVGVNNPNQVTAILEKFADKVAIEVGNSFPVWIADFNGEKFDFAVARKEKKNGESRKDFFVDIKNVSIEDDLFRRDLTINAIAQNVLTGEIVDPFNGGSDLQNKIAREVSPAFAEDSLRVVRAARFIARFNLKPTQSLINLCKSLEPTDMPNERVGTELEKMVKQAVKPSLFFRFLKDVNWLRFHFQQIQNLIGLEQDPIWHPEGDVFEHTMHCMDAANTPFMRVVMLCHDLGKVSTTKTENGRITAKGHAKAGVKPTKNMLNSIKFWDHSKVNQVAFLVENHMVHTSPPTTRKGVARLMRKIQKVGLQFSHLVEVCRCDVSGRPPLEGFTPEIGQTIANELEQSNSLTPIVTGDMLKKVGFKEGKELGMKKAELLSLQDEGVLTPDNWKDFL
jgi:tRNA nucleotidyltransferase (CCA-adding enzyme)